MVMIAQMKDKRQLKIKIKEAVCGLYTEVSIRPETGFHFPLGKKALLGVGYPEEVLESIPNAAKESFAGVGFHFQNDVIKEGDLVLDIGSGSGTDLIIAAQKVGSEGKAVGVDITEAMIAKGLVSAKEAGLNNVSIVEADAEKLPFKNKTFDVVISNGVINLIHDKEKAFKEIFRVLKPGGYLSIADIALAKPISEKSRENPALWANCIVGALMDDVYLKMIKDTGFNDVEVTDDLDYFANSDVESTRNVAASFGAHSIVIKAQKPKIKVKRLT